MDAPPRAPEGQSSANMMQQAGKNKHKANQTNQFQEEEDENGRGCVLRLRRDRTLYQEVQEQQGQEEPARAEICQRDLICTILLQI